MSEPLIPNWAAPKWYDDPASYDLIVDGVVKKLCGSYREALEAIHGLPLPFGEARIKNADGETMLLKHGQPVVVRRA